MDEFSEKFRRGVGVISDPKIYVADLKGTSVMTFGKNPQHDFPKIHPFLKGQASLSLLRGLQAWLKFE